MSENKNNIDNIVGYIIDGSTPIKARFVSKSPPPLGGYVLVEIDSIKYLAIVDKINTRSITLSTLINVYDPLVVEKVSRQTSGEDVFFECTARIASSVELGSLKLPSKPPLPGTPVLKADKKVLEEFFTRGRSSIRIGVLSSHPEVEVRVSANQLVTRHLAVLAVTGAGKTNTVAVILERLTSELNATSIVFDFHGEYTLTGFSASTHLVDPKINPRNLNIGELMTLLGIERRFYNQERVLRKALNKVKQSSVLRRTFLEELRSSVEGLKAIEDSKAVAAVYNKIESLLEKYSEILDDRASDVIDEIEYGAINIIDLSRLDEEAADVIVSHFLRRIMMERKKFKLQGTGLPVPVLTVIEEAHVLIPREGETLSKYWVSRIAREGRKFGVGLILVSQRPRGLDPNALSQMNNKIILRIVEPSDLKYVRESSESLGEELAEQLPSLATGEAIVIGPFVRLPARVKIDLFKGRLGGGDPDVVREWEQFKTRKFVEEEELSRSISDLVMLSPLGEESGK